MGEASGNIIEQPDEESQALIDLVADRLEEAWQTSDDPQLVDFLPDCDDPARTWARVELIKIDLWHRWRGGQKKKLEEYLIGDWNDLRAKPNFLEKLLTAECLSRAVFDIMPERGELEDRFPEVSDRIDLNRVKSEAASATTFWKRTPVADPDLAPTPGLDDYKIIRLLGQGAMARVYLVRDQQLPRLVAVKVPLPDGNNSWDETRVERFLEEAGILAKLNHPGIVPIYNLGRCEDGTPFFVMEYVEGTSLRALLDSESLSCDRIADMMSQIAEALEYAHRHGVYHLDLKPGNILLEKNGRARVADFGLAVEERVQRLLVGQCRGAPAYMSPEQVRGETHHLDGRADVWSIGVMLYEMLTGRHPFQGKTFDELFDEIQHRDPKPPRMIDDGVPEPLERICLKCLSKSLTGRYQTAGDVKKELRQYLKGNEVKDKDTQRHLPLAWIAGALVAAVILAVGAFSYLNPITPKMSKDTSDVVLLPTPQEMTGMLALRVTPPESTVKIIGDQGNRLIEVTDGRAEISVSAGEVQLEVEAVDFRSVSLKFTVGAGQTVEPPSISLSPSSELGEFKLELYILAEHVDATQMDDPIDEMFAVLRKKLVEYRARCYACPEAVREARLPIRAAELLSRLPWPSDRLSVETVPPDLLESFGPNRPAELVAVWRDEEQQGPIRSVMYSPNGEHVIAATGQQVSGWNASNGEQLRRLKHDRRQVESVGQSSDGKTLITVERGVYGFIRIWDVHIWEQAQPKEDVRFRDGVLGQPVCSVSLDGRRLAVRSKTIGSKTVQLWEFNEDNILKPLKKYLPKEQRAMNGTPVSLSPDGRTVAFVNTERAAVLWDVDARADSSIHNVDAGPVRAIVFSPDGKTLAYCISNRVGEDANGRGAIGRRKQASKGGDAEAVRLWDVSERRPLTAPLSCARSVNSLAFSPDGSKLAAGGDEINVWAVDPIATQPLRHLRRFPVQSTISQGAFGPGSRHLAIANDDENDAKVYIFRLAPLGDSSSLPANSPAEDG